MFGERMRMLRKEAGLTQVQVAEKSGVPWRTYQDVEAGKQPSYGTMIKLADCFNVSLDYLTGRTGERRLRR